jgi:hypothetical protein
VLTLVLWHVDKKGGNVSLINKQSKLASVYSGYTKTFSILVATLSSKETTESAECSVVDFKLNVMIIWDSGLSLWG